VAKVKKRAGLTGVRNVKAGKTARGKKTATGRQGRPPAKAAKSATAAKAVKSGRSDKAIKAIKALKRGKQAMSDQPVGRVVVRELDPQQKCGEGTSVQFLYRVDHTVDGHRTAHLVFFDPHGWYCEHGRTCPAVAHAKKHNGQFARVS
jgi:hypothetical protein